MEQMRYIGPIIHLQGKTALVRDLEPSGSSVLAQFDDRALTRDNQPWPMGREEEYLPHARFATWVDTKPEEIPATALGFGWHEFPRESFEMRPLTRTLV